MQTNVQRLASPPNAVQCLKIKKPQRLTHNLVRAERLSNVTTVEREGAEHATSPGIPLDKPCCALLSDPTDPHQLMFPLGFILDCISALHKSTAHISSLYDCRRKGKHNWSCTSSRKHRKWELWKIQEGSMEKAS